jgi:hypothetical protein
MEDIAIYIILLISIYILYLTIKYKYTVCPSEDDIVKPLKAVSISQIFSRMFQDEAPRPGKISLNVASQQVPMY